MLHTPLPRANPPSEPMDIRFCDLCNESVPASDFAKGLAYMRKGKVICASCERAMGGGQAAASPAAPPAQGSRKATSSPSAQGGRLSTAPPPVPSPYATVSLDGPPVQAKSSWAGAAALFVATGALAAAGTGGLMLAERLDDVESSVQANGYSARAALDEIRRERAGLIQPLEGRISDAIQAAGDAASGVRAETTAEVAALHARLATSEARSTELRNQLDAARQQSENARAEARRALDAREAEISSLQKVVQFHGDSLVELRERIREAGALVAAGQIPAGAGGAVGAPGAAAGTPGAAPAASWATLLPDLQNADEAQRLTAVLNLGETGDPAVAEYIIPMLKDSDSFVRMVSVQALGDLGYKPAVPHLIDGLSDQRWTVREAARDSLRSITGKDFGFDPTARELEMKKRIDQWRGWWRREGDNFLTQD